MSCDKNKTHERVAMYPIQFFLKVQTKENMGPKTSRSTNPVSARDRKLFPTSPEVLHNLLETYIFDDHKMDAYQHIIGYRHGSNVIETNYADQLWTHALRFGNIFSEAQLNR